MVDRLEIFRSLGLNDASVVAPADILARLDAELEKRRIERERADVAQNADAIRSRCKSFIGFVREAWHVLEPRTPFVEGWVTRAICAHLEAITFGRFLAMNVPNKVRFNVPPGCTKSVLVSVMHNAWEWGPCDMAHMRFLSTSYSGEYVKRDTRKTRDLIQSDWYQQLWPHVKLVRTGETSFENSARGSREGVAFDGLTSGRGDRLTIDDPLSVAQSKSDADREHAKFIMRESVPTRVNDPVKSATVLIMQRVHTDDPSGVWEQLGAPHVALVLPMRFEVARRCTTPIFVDPREFEGELLFPERFPREWVDRVERTEMTSYAVSGQHQQRPVPREGGMFKRHWFKMRSTWPQGYRWCRHWDLADTEETYGADPPYTAGVLLGKPHDGSPGYCVGSVVRCREEAPAVRKLVKQTAELDRELIAGLGGTYEVQVPQDPGSAGKTVARDMISMLDGFDAHKLIETGSKIDRAEPFATQAENGNVELLTAGWNEAYLSEMTNFPGLKFKDQADATSGAYVRLQIKRRWEPKLVRSGAIAIYGR
jgi:predicted phage terminase large subunit-like protein